MTSAIMATDKAASAKATGEKKKQVSASREDYLKAIWSLSERHEDENSEAMTNDLAVRLNVSPPAVSRMLKRMERESLVVYMPYYGARLTEKGRRIALKIVRRHRLIELFLAEILHYAPEAIHEEAERLEHHISDEFERKIDALLNYPEKCPHGSPIPNRSGEFQRGR